MTHDYEISRLNQPEIKGDVEHLFELPVVQIDEHQSNVTTPDNSNVILTSILGIPDPDEDMEPEPPENKVQH